MIPGSSESDLLWMLVHNREGTWCCLRNFLTKPCRLSHGDIPMLFQYGVVPVPCRQRVSPAKRV